MYHEEIDPADNDENKLRDAFIKVEELECDPLPEGTIAHAYAELAHLLKDRVEDLETYVGYSAQGKAEESRLTQMSVALDEAHDQILATERSAEKLKAELSSEREEHRLTQETMARISDVATEQARLLQAANLLHCSPANVDDILKGRGFLEAGDFRGQQLGTGKAATFSERLLCFLNSEVAKGTITLKERA